MVVGTIGYKGLEICHGPLCAFHLKIQGSFIHARLCTIIVQELELAKHITLHTNGESLLKRSSSHSHSSSVLQRFNLLSGLPMATVLLFLASSKVNFVNDDSYQ